MATASRASCVFFRGRAGASPHLSVVIPAYNEEARLGPTMEALLREPLFLGMAVEFLVINDGSTDNTQEIATALARRDTRVGVYMVGARRGKGAAVRVGALLSRGRFVLAMDADLPVKPAMAGEFLRRARADADVVIASKFLAGSSCSEGLPLLRRALSRAHRLVRDLLFRLGVADANGGFKLFTRRAVNLLFPTQQCRGFAADTEMLLLARDSGLRVVEAAVHWRHDPGSRVRPFRDSLFTLMELALLKWRRIRENRRCPRFRAPAATAISQRTFSVARTLSSGRQARR